jgi:hypothetical protein
MSWKDSRGRRVSASSKPPALPQTGQGRDAVPKNHSSPHRPRPSPSPPSICKINFEAPGYLGTALKIHAARERTSVRHVILKALKQAGFEITDSDMVEDGRRLRGSNRLN